MLVGADGLGRGEVAAAGEHRQPGEQAAFVLEQQVVAPVHHRPERLLAGQGGAGTPGEQPEAVAEPFGQGGQRQRTETGGGELDGQGQAVEPAADVLDDVARLPVCQEAGSHGPGAIGEQLDGARRGQPAHGQQDFPWDAERLAAGGDQPETGHRSDQGIGQRAASPMTCSQLSRTTSSDRPARCRTMSCVVDPAG